MKSRLPGELVSVPGSLKEEAGCMLQPCHTAVGPVLRWAVNCLSLHHSFTSALQAVLANIISNDKCSWNTASVWITTQGVFGNNCSWYSGFELASKQEDDTCSLSSEYPLLNGCGQQTCAEAVSNPHGLWCVHTGFVLYVNVMTF